MAVIRLENPSENPTEANDYKKQNVLIKKSRICCNFYCTVNPGVSDGYAVFTFKKGNFFEHNNSMYVCNSDIVLQFDVSDGKSILYLVFDGINYYFTEVRPIDFWDHQLQGYYNNTIQYIGVVVVQYNRKSNKKTKVNNVVTLQKASPGQIYVRYPNCPPPHFFYWGKWQDVSSAFAGDFFRVVNTLAERKSLSYDMGRQDHQLQQHNHAITPGISISVRTPNQRFFYTGALTEENFRNFIVPSYTELEGNVGTVRGNETRPDNQTIEIYKCISERS